MGRKRRNLPRSISSQFHVLDRLQMHIPFPPLVLLLFIHRLVLLVVIAARNIIDILRMACELHKFCVRALFHQHNTDKQLEVQAGTSSESLVASSMYRGGLASYRRVRRVCEREREREAGKTEREQTSESVNS
jgi:hypothetical protein